MIPSEFYRAQFGRLERERRRQEGQLVQSLRHDAIASFAELGFPTTRQEEWRYTDVGPIARTSFQPLGDGAGAGRRLLEALGNLPCVDGKGRRLVFVNGRYVADLSSAGALAGGVVIDSLAAAIEARAELVEPHLARHATSRQHAFVALNTAFFQDGAFVFLPAGAVLEETVYLVFVSVADAEPGMAHPRNLIVAGPSSKGTVVEWHVGSGSVAYLSNVVSEVVVGAEAALGHYVVEQQSQESFHVETVSIHQDRGSAVRAHTVSLAGGLLRNDATVVLGGEESDCALDGLYVLGGRDHVDNRTVIDHARPGCSSRETYKGVLDGGASGAFYGKIVVRPDAQRTDARQTNQTLLLSDDAVMNTRPQLEILADDVKCAHGAAVGHLDDDAIFYLRSRGIDFDRARSLLTYGFVSEVLGGMEAKPLRAALEDLLAERLGVGRAVKGGP